MLVLVSSPFPRYFLKALSFGLLKVGIVCVWGGWWFKNSKKMHSITVKTSNHLIITDTNHCIFICVDMFFLYDLKTKDNSIICIYDQCSEKKKKMEFMNLSHYGRLLLQTWLLLNLNTIPHNCIG